MQEVTQPCGMKEAPNSQFWLCVARANSSHCAAALLRRLLHAIWTLLLKFDFQARVCFEVFDNFIISSYNVPDRCASPFGCELAQLVQVESYELFNLKHVYTIT